MTKYRPRFYGAVAKDGSHIRSVELAGNPEMAETLLMENWTPALKALYDVKPVIVTVDTAAEAEASDK